MGLGDLVFHFWYSFVAAPDIARFWDVSVPSWAVFDTSIGHGKKTEPISEEKGRE